MGVSPAVLFRSSLDAASFRRAVMALDGEFDLDAEAMIELGSAYLERYPDRKHDRDLEKVRIGYELARVCAVEKMVREVPAVRRDFYRKALSDALSAGPAAEAMAREFGTAALVRDLALLRTALDGIKTTIDGLPKGMIRERFAGGVSHLFNVLYILKLKSRPPGG